MSDTGARSQESGAAVWRPVWQPDAQLRSLLEALVREEEAEGGAGKFARNYLPWTETVWSKMRLALNSQRESKSYFEQVSDATRDEAIADLRAIPKQILEKRAERAGRYQSRLLELSYVIALKQAIKEAQDKPNEERVVMVVAPTGGGKTWMKKAMQEAFKTACDVQATQTWRAPGSSTLIMREIARAVDLRGHQGSSGPVIEAALERDRGLYAWPVFFDEAEFLGNAGLFAVRFLCNKTKLVPVLLTTPEGLMDWQTHFKAAYRHVARRTHDWIRVDVIKQEDVAPFFADNAFARAELGLQAVATAASHFGHFSLVRRVAERMHLKKGFTKAQLDDAIAKAQGAMTNGGAK